MKKSKFFEGLEIETEFGFVPFSGIRKISNRETIKVTLEGSTSIDCTPDHRFVIGGKSIFASDLTLGDYLECKDGLKKIEHIQKSDKGDVFDIIEVENPHSSFYANTINNHNCSFTGSSYTLIDGDILSRLQATDPPFYPEEGYYIWKRPEPGRLYAFGVDVAKGANSDYHVINIYDVTKHHLNGKYEQVAIFRRNDISVFDFKDKILEIAKQWFDPVIIVENNDLGHAVVHEMYFESGYENTYYDYDRGEYGVRATSKTKALALAHFREDVEEWKMKINSSDMITELGYYEEVRTGVFQARNGRGFHDDTVASGYWVSYLLRSRFWEDYLDWWLKNNDPKSQEMMAILNNEASQKDSEMADSFMSALGGGSSDDEIMNSFQRELGM